MKVAAAAFTNSGSTPSPAGGGHSGSTPSVAVGGISRVKNARGNPLAIVVFWDPASYSATDAILTWKRAEAAWRAGEEEQVGH